MNALFPSFQTIRVKGRILRLDEPWIMGILNATPDSFYEESRTLDVAVCIERVAEMIVMGATIIDIGGHSTRPGAEPVSVSDEIDRVVPIISSLRQHFPSLLISIDTYRLAVAQAAIAAGADIFNDIGAGQMDQGIFAWVAQNQVPYILSHSRGAFDQVHEVPNYQDVVSDVWSDLALKLQHLRTLGAKDVIIDLGLGFSKSIDHNYALLANLSAFKTLGAPILIGVSRKSMIYKTLGITAAESLNGTSVLHTIALQQGANVLRVHDVAAAKEVITLVSKLQSNGLSNLV
ncbi:dihydropteroate synthase [Aquirufa sp.]|uniref:dihydropteroate synthase n=1 Tax=Aquirufa sp. TaxID=2676249 RepID=UPI0037BF39E5